jgi:hypothetical protein
MTLAMHEQDGLLGGTKDLRENPVFNDQKLKLGIFSANCSGGVIMSDAPTGFRVTWDQQLEIAPDGGPARLRGDGAGGAVDRLPR